MGFSPSACDHRERVLDPPRGQSGGAVPALCATAPSLATLSSTHGSFCILTAVAWPYANGPRHIGHVSGFGVPSDVFSRYMRMAVLMVSGTDEHGTAIRVAGRRRG